MNCKPMLVHSYVLLNGILEESTDEIATIFSKNEQK